ncbi:response regulator, partial [Candidatus Desantisbacteria bacterium]|nr:response regulator [Candidatus Desantisbacteria bacterium]
LNEILILAGYDVVLVDDPVLIVKIVDETNPDIILLDIRMPVKNGYEVANEIKSLARNCNIPIIGMTGYYRDKDLLLMNICGIQKCLRKPLYPLDIIYQIETVIK